MLRELYKEKKRKEAKKSGGKPKKEIEEERPDYFSVFTRGELKFSGWENVREVEEGILHSSKATAGGSNILFEWRKPQRMIEEDRVYRKNAANTNDANITNDALLNPDGGGQINSEMLGSNKDLNKVLL